MSTIAVRRGLELDVAGRAVFRGIGQVFFQENAWSGLAFVAGLALGSPRMAMAAVVGSALGLATALATRFGRDEPARAAWVLVGSFVGMLMGSHHASAASRAIDPERLVDRALFENVALGFYGYNAALTAVARRAVFGDADFGRVDRTHSAFRDAGAYGAVCAGDLVDAGAWLP